MLMSSRNAPYSRSLTGCDAGPTITVTMVPIVGETIRFSGSAGASRVVYVTACEVRCVVAEKVDYDAVSGSLRAGRRSDGRYRPISAAWHRCTYIGVMVASPPPVIARLHFHLPVPAHEPAQRPGDTRLPRQCGTDAPSYATSCDRLPANPPRCGRISRLPHGVPLGFAQRFPASHMGRQYPTW